MNSKNKQVINIYYTNAFSRDAEKNIENSICNPPTKSKIIDISVDLPGVTFGDSCREIGVVQPGSKILSNHRAKQIYTTEKYMHWQKDVPERWKLLGNCIKVFLSTSFCSLGIEVLR
jgi:hypothetical protein